MVRITAIGKIINFIHQNHLTAMKPWSTRYGANGQKKNCYTFKLTKKVRFILNLISGGDIVIMLKSVLNREEMTEITSCETIKNLVNCYKSTSLKKRFHMINAFKESNIKYYQLRKFGYTVSRHLWKECENKNERRKGGRRPKSVVIRKEIREYLRENSNVASNRLVKIKDPDSNFYKQRRPARYLVDNLTELYKNFPLKDFISKSTFIKYAKISGEFKKPHRITDICDYCEWGKYLQSEIKQKAISKKFATNENYDYTLFKHFCKENLTQFKDNEIQYNEAQIAEKMFFQNINSKIQDLETIKFHKNIATSQRKTYNDQRKDVNLLKKSVLIEVDYKQKIAIGMGPRQINREYYQQILKSCLGFGIYYYDEIEAKIKLLNVDVISSDLSEEAVSVVRGFRFYRLQRFFKNFEKKNLIIWMDCGKHFRNNYLMGYLLRELAEENIQVNINFFAEKHGKNARDAHFANVTKFVNAASLKKKLCSSQDIVNAINEGQKIANEKSKRQIETIAIVLDFDDNEFIKLNYPVLQCLTIQNIESFYNYRTDKEFRIFTSVLSKDTCLLEMIPSKYAEEPNNYTITPEEPLLENDLSDNVIYLKKKHFRIQCAMNQMKKKMNQLQGTQMECQESIEFLDVFTFGFTELEYLETGVRAPAFCRKKATKAKKKCSECRSDCNFTYEMLLNSKSRLSQREINDELFLHNHPKSRSILENGRKRSRTTEESAQELADHYEFAHKIKKA